jgi:hypothetical protein
MFRNKRGVYYSLMPLNLGCIEVEVLVYIVKWKLML